MAKDREHRYGSAEELAADLRRTLADEPIRARPPTRAYQVAKFTRRHKGLVTGLALAFSAMAISTVTATAQYLEKARLLAQKTDEADATNEAIGFLEDILDQADPYTEDEFSVHEVARIAKARIADEFANRPRVRGRLLHMLGRAHNNLNLTKDAPPMLQEALELRVEQFGLESIEAAETRLALGVTHRTLGELAPAEHHLRGAVGTLRAHSMRGALWVEALSSLGNLLMDLGEFEEAAQVQAEAFEEARLTLDQGDAQHISIRHNIACRHMITEEFGEAERLFLELLEEIPNQASLRITILQTLASTYFRQLRHEEAEGTMRGALAQALENYGPGSPITRQYRQRLSSILTETGKIGEAVTMMRAVHDELIANGQRETRAGAWAAHDLAFVIHELPDPTGAEELYLETIEYLHEHDGAEDPLMYLAMHNLAMLLLDQGRLDEAEMFESEALAWRRHSRGASDTDTLASMRGLGDILDAMGRTDEAIDLRMEVVPTAAAIFGAWGRYTVEVRLQAVEILIRSERYAEADPLLMEAEQDPEPSPKTRSRIERSRSRIAAGLERDR